MLNYSWSHAGLWSVIKYVKDSNINCAVFYICFQASFATVGSLASVFSDARGTGPILYTIIFAERLESSLIIFHNGD